ncbi:MAG: hypothetical protein QXJ69_05545 [Desulfurococcaceae archaeon]
MGERALSETREVVFVVKVGEKEIPVTEDVLKMVREYVRTPMSLEELAEKLGLESWEEAYEFVKALPLWIMWTPPSLWEYRRRWISSKMSKEQ